VFSNSPSQKFASFGTGEFSHSDNISSSTVQTQTIFSELELIKVVTSVEENI